MARGRPAGSQIRQNIINLLAAVKKPLYGYELHKIYIQLFIPCTREVVYYNLKKGVKRGEIILHSVKEEQGNFSWGGTVKKRYYTYGPNSNPKELLHEVLKKLKEITGK